MAPRRRRHQHISYADIRVQKQSSRADRLQIQTPRAVRMEPYRWVAVSLAHPSANSLRPKEPRTEGTAHVPTKVSAAATGRLRDRRQACTRVSRAIGARWSTGLNALNGRPITSAEWAAGMNYELAAHLKVLMRRVEEEVNRSWEERVLDVGYEHCLENFRTGDTIGGTPEHYQKTCKTPTLTRRRARLHSRRTLGHDKHYFGPRPTSFT